MNTTTQFLYNMWNTQIYNPDLIHVAIVCVVGIILLIITRYILLYHIGLSIILVEAHAISSKKKILWDLILMKDIQSEMEKELEQASLRATFQG